MYNSPLLQELEERFKNKGDLPILRDTAVKVMKVTEDRVSGAPELTRVILRDQGLTAKVLKVSNSIYYNPGDKEINTVSKAVVVLGFDMVRSISLGLSFVEMFQKHHPGIDIKKIVADSFIAATQASEMANLLRHPQPEEVFIASLLYRLGPMTVAYYLPEEYVKTRKLMAENGISHGEAEREVLGFLFNQVGAAFAKEWSLPAGVVYTLSSSPPSDSGSSPVRAPLEQIRAIAHLSNRITENLFTPEDVSPEQSRRRGDDLVGLIQKVQDCFDIQSDEVIRLIETSYQKAKEVSGLFGIEKKKFRPLTAETATDSPALRDRLLNRLGEIFEGKGEEERKEGDGIEQEERPVEMDHTEETAVGEEPPETSRALLQLKFLQEISLHLFGNQDINTLFNMILEGLHRGIGFDRALLALCNPQKTRVTGRYSLGGDSQDMASHLDLPLDPEDNIFGKSFAELTPCFVQDTMSEAFRPLIPDVIRYTFRADSFVISPIHARGNIIGFFYADKAVSGKPVTAEDYQSFFHFTLQANIGLERLMMGTRK